MGTSRPEIAVGVRQLACDNGDGSEVAAGREEKGKGVMVRRIKLRGSQAWGPPVARHFVRRGERGNRRWT
jgi:hypothetical protein